MRTCLNAPYGAPCFLAQLSLRLSRAISARLNTPYGAPCFLTSRHSLMRRQALPGLNTPYGAPRFLTHRTSTCPSRANSSLNAPYGAPRFLTSTLLPRGNVRTCLNAPYGAPCFLTFIKLHIADYTYSRLNAPYGAPCFLTARRVAPVVTRGNDTSDRQGPKKQESDPQARRQISRLFVAIRRIATDGQQHSSRPEHSRSRRSVAPLHACTTPHAKQPTNLTQTRTPPTRPIPHTEAGTHRTAQRDGPRPRIGA